MRQRSSRCRNDGFLFDKRRDRRNIDIVSIVVNFDYLRRRRKMFRNVQICILSSVLGELGPVNFIGIVSDDLSLDRPDP